VQALGGKNSETRKRGVRETERIRRGLLILEERKGEGKNTLLGVHDAKVAKRVRKWRTKKEEDSTF